MKCVHENRRHCLRWLGHSFPMPSESLLRCALAFQTDNDWKMVGSDQSMTLQMCMKSLNSGLVRLDVIRLPELELRDSLLPRPREQMVWDNTGYGSVLQLVVLYSACFYFCTVVQLTILPLAFTISRHFFCLSIWCCEVATKTEHVGARLVAIQTELKHLTDCPPDYTFQTEPS